MNKAVEAVPQSACDRPLAGEDFRCRAGHEDVVVGGELEVEVAAGQVRQELAAGAAGEHAGNADGVGELLWRLNLTADWSGVILMLLLTLLK